MSEASDRTEEATPRRRQEARRDGQVAKSADLTAAACLTLAGLGVAHLVEARLGELLHLTRVALEAASNPAGREVSTEALLTQALHAGAGLVLPVLMTCVAAGILTTVCQTGLLWAPKSIRPKLERISPAAGIKRLFSAERLMVVLKAAVALTLCVALAAASTSGHLPTIVSLPALEHTALIPLVGVHISSLIALCGLALLLPGALDYALVRRRMNRQLRMSRKQVRDEHKRDEGDPFIKGERKRAHRELSAAPSRALSDAKVLLVNPTHVAVALHHGPTLPVPEVGARGQGEDAFELRARARALGLPIIRDVPLARALVTLDPGSPVPERLFAAVAAVLATVYRAELAASRDRRGVD